MSSKKAKTKDEASSSRGGFGGESIVADCGLNRSTCGYCKSSSRSSISHGLWTESLTVNDYQALLDRGWRRSGCFLYKPEMEKTCCPSYTIRLKASDFVPSKEQQRVRRRLERFLDGELDAKPSEQTEEQDVSFSREVSVSVRKSLGAAKREQNNDVEPIMKDLSEQIDNAVQKCIQSGDLPCNIQIPKASVKKVISAKRKKLAEGSEELLYTSNIAFPIVAAIKHTQTSEKGKKNVEESRLSPEVVSEKLLSAMDKVGKFIDFSVKVCKGHINFLSATRVTSSDRNDEESLGTTTAKSSSNNLRGRKRKLEMHLKRSSFDPEEYELYKRYQLKVHNDKPESISETSYKKFLVDTPLIEVPPSRYDDQEKVPPCGFGSYHQQYRVDDRLIAVGVIDILPKCLSSKYLFWDPDFASLSIGKYSALQEIDWVKQNQAHCSTLEYYYLGYYIHSCNKMKYKAAYRPSELLCPLRYQWVPFEVAKPLLDKKPYSVLSNYTKVSRSSSSPQASETLGESTSEHEDMELGVTNDDDDDDDDDEMYNSDEDSDSSRNRSGITNILISFDGPRLRYKDIPRIKNRMVLKELESRLVNYQKVVGAELSERMVYELR
ncbi:PREDICTED: arginyl-tRNA--protein transferase 2 isoform X1 [Camelina sativa]|uniref:Arginyl-tRNA--protein transferase n=2 Tax=Camelina sativa TaxID=90675 RepID=A0ABM0XJ71_CAMSA|nr:PREDICTED: arginyl-tRNA--protein transferase 2 isoform X1 [Camelina sativa]